ncbi:phospho-2-dehydro-3-deoxyheptonate aldolase [Plantactinospora sp. KBS50]|nr:phospho-2-dehydro-3-deoxyheptonate aldolase [Plantactinospora sp. KBS50]
MDGADPREGADPLDGAAVADDAGAAEWRPAIWHSLPRVHQPGWSGPGLRRARAELAAAAPLTSLAEVRLLQDRLARVAGAGAFLLQAGDCAEPFGPEAVLASRRKHALIGRMSVLISDRTGLPVVTAARIAGQFAKPRSQPTEIVDGRHLPSFRGLLVNGAEPTAAARQERASRLVDGYATAAGVFAELRRLAGADPAEHGVTVRRDGAWRHRGLWTSHEALVLDYEEPLTRRDEQTGRWYLASTHLPWIGYRTGAPDGAHVSFLAGVANPVACKVGPETDPEDLVRTCERLDPLGVPGRLTLISRQGAALVRDRLPRLVAAVRRAGRPVTWMCDPMHGNTVRADGGRKTRHYGDIVDELRGFFAVLARFGQWPGGVQLEVAAEPVAECRGGPGAEPADPDLGYRSLCDPRLNDAQSLGLAATIADLLAAAVAARPDPAAALASIR